MAYPEFGQLNSINWQRAGFSCFKQLIINGQFPEASDFSAKTDQFTHMQYLLLKSLVNYLQRTGQIRGQFTQLEILLHSGAILKKSLLYSLLVEMNKMQDSARRKWETEIGTLINELDWGRSCEYVLGISSNISVHESFLKVRTRWYYVPTKVHKMFPASDTICW